MERFITYGSIESVDNFAFKMKEYQEKIDTALPPITFNLTEKIHGMNASYVYTKESIWYQTRKKIIEPDDSSGLSTFFKKRENQMNNICESLIADHEIDTNKFGIVLYGEFAGGNIQKKSAFSGAEKSFAIFEYAKIFPLDETLCSNRWVSTNDYDADDERIYNVTNRTNLSMEIDVNKMISYKDKFDELIKNIEENSDFANYLELDNVGEGYVFQGMYDNALLRFKIKGEAHVHKKGDKSSNNLVAEKKVDPKLIEFVDTIACSASRLDQGWTELFIHGDNKPEDRNIGLFLNWVKADVWKEELSIISELELDIKDIQKFVSKSALEYFKYRRQELL